MRRVPMVPPLVMLCEYCEEKGIRGGMYPAPIGSTTLACITCGYVKYGSWVLDAFSGEEE